MKPHDLPNLVRALRLLRRDGFHLRPLRTWKAPPEVLQAARANIRQAGSHSSAPVAFFTIVAHWFGLSMVPPVIAAQLEECLPRTVH